MSDADPLRLVGDGLELRLPAPRDAAGLLAAGSDPEVVRWFSWGPYAELGEPEAWIAAQAVRRARGEALALVVVPAGRDASGVIELSELHRRDRRATVGTWLARDLWGTGANAEAKRLLLGLAFGPLGLERVTAYADVRNARSRRALARLGFVHEGTLRAHHRHGDERKGVELHGLLREEHLARDPGDVAWTGALPEAFVVAEPAPA